MSNELSRSIVLPRPPRIDDPELSRYINSLHSALMANHRRIVARIENNVWEDLRVPITSTKLGGAKDPGFAKVLDDGAASQGVYVYWFDKANEEELFFTAQLPHSYDEGTDIVAHVHWVGKSTAPGAGTDVSWGLEYTWANTNGTFGNTTIIYGDEQSNGSTETITANKHYLTSIGTITGTGKTISSMLICRVFRDAPGNGGTDDYDDDAGLIEVDFHFEKNTSGSKTETAK